MFSIAYIELKLCQYFHSLTIVYDIVKLNLT